MQSDTPPLYALVLAGGHSRRMGADKAAIDYHGEPEVRRAFRLVNALCPNAFVSVRPDQADDPLYADLPRIVDEVSSEGPAIGILAAMRAHPGAAWLVVGCDMPFLDEPALQRLVSERDPNRAVTAYAAEDGAAEPLCAIYEPQCREAIEEAVAQRQRGMRRLYRQWDAKLIDPQPETTVSANTPEERAQFQSQINAQGQATCKQ